MTSAGAGSVRVADITTQLPECEGRERSRGWLESAKMWQYHEDSENLGMESISFLFSTFTQDFPLIMLHFERLSEKYCTSETLWEMSPTKQSLYLCLANVRSLF